jgi:hypothetical protein
VASRDLHVAQAHAGVQPGDQGVVQHVRVHPRHPDPGARGQVLEPTGRRVPVHPRPDGVAQDRTAGQLRVGSVSVGCRSSATSGHFGTIDRLVVPALLHTSDRCEKESAARLEVTIRIHGGCTLSRYRFNPPPGWPAPPPGWVPPEGWVPDPRLPAAPEGWQWWMPDEETPAADPYVNTGQQAPSISPGHRAAPAVGAASATAMGPPSISTRAPTSGGLGGIFGGGKKRLEEENEQLRKQIRGSPGTVETSRSVILLLSGPW